MAAEQPSATPSSGSPYEAASHRRGNGENQPPTDVSIDHRRHLPAPCSVATPSSLRSPFRLPAGLCVFPRTNRDTASTPRFILEKEKEKKKRKGKEKRKRKKERKIRKKSPFPPGFPTEFLSLRSRLVVENRRRRMWCCKRLDSSDWPVTTIVRGNASFLHVANFFDTSSRTRHCPSRGSFSPPLFSFFLDFHLLFFLILSAQINLFDPRCYGIFADRPVQFFMIFGSNVISSSHRCFPFVFASPDIVSFGEAFHERFSFYAVSTLLLLLYRSVKVAYLG